MRKSKRKAHMSTNIELTSLIDEIYALKKRREITVKALDDQIDSLTAELTLAMTAAGSDHETGRLAQAGWRRSQEVKVKDWLRFYQWVSTHKAWDCLSRRITPTAVLARLQANEAVPEVEVESRVSLVITKLTDGR